MGFVRANKRLLIGVLMADAVVMAYWWIVPPTEEHTVSGALFHLCGFLVAEAFALNELPARIVMFLVTYLEILVTVLVIRALWRTLRHISTL